MTKSLALQRVKMKCPSVAALWASTPPSHQVTAVFIIPEASALFTGGSDGSIIRWSFASSSISPVCLLSGHAASISSLTGTVQSFLLSSCTNGVLCLWSGSASSRCRRRRKLPPWTGTPLIIKQDPLSDRNVLVLCGSAEIHKKRAIKYVVLVVDCVSLNVVKTVFHGGLAIGSPLEMGVFGSEVLLVDSTGRLQSLEVSEILDHDALEGSVVSYTSNSSDTGSISTGENSDNSVQAAIFHQDGKILALVYPSKCLFKWVNEGNTIGEISLLGTSLFNEESKDKLKTGIFLRDEDPKSVDLDETIMFNFALCGTNGAAIMFQILNSGDLFKFEPLCEIPPICTLQEGNKPTISFCHFNKHLVRIESNSTTIGKSSLWKPYISNWSLENLESNSSPNLCNQISSGGFPGKNSKLNEKMVTSSLVLSEDSFVPHSIIYGFNTGEIEVISFMESKSNFGGGVFPYISDKFFLGHTGPILCLATHSIHKNQTRLLISGSEDCTVRIWDFSSGISLSVFHHHVKPVKQILLPPECAFPPWNDCFLSVGEDSCVALVSFETMRVERVLTGHTHSPNLVAWDGNKGYVACLCKNLNLHLNILYIWDLKTGACERVIHGPSSNSMFDHFCNGIYKNALTGSVLGGTTSNSSLLVPIFKDPKNLKKGAVLRSAHDIREDILRLGFSSSKQQERKKKKLKAPIKCSCPFPGIASLQFDLSALMAPSNRVSCEHSTNLKSKSSDEIESPAKESLEGRLLRFSLCFLHLWGVDCELDKLLVEDMNVCKPEDCQLATGTVGDRGAVSLMFPGTEPTLELWRSSPEFCAMRSLTMVSLAQHMISLSRSCTNASSALAAFYTRNFAEKVTNIKPPSLQLLVSFWQHQCEHVRMAARSLFHCAAPRAVPPPLSRPKSQTSDLQSTPELDASSIIHYLDSFENQEWASWIGATNQDSMAANIIVASALSVWYPSIVKEGLAGIVVNHLIKLLMSMNELHSSTAAELLAEGMESTWIYHLCPEINHFISDVFFQIECLTGTQNPSTVLIREALVDTLLPSLAVADILGFFGVIEGQIWKTSSDSPVHIAALKTLIRVVRGNPKVLVIHLDKVIGFVLHTMDPSNLVMRKACFGTSMIALREIARVFSMVSLNESLTRLAIGDAIGDVKNATIRIYDLESVTKIRILDASAPPGLPILLEGALNNKIATAISALSFSPDGEGLVAFSENGLMIRWWSLGTAWWERLSSTRSLVPVQCTKLIYVPPWEGFSPNSSRLSIMTSFLDHNNRTDHETPRELDEGERMRVLIRNLDLSYRLRWVGPKAVNLMRNNQDLGTFPLS